MMYAINDIYLAVQGEGTLTGIPMVVVRMQGCSVGCTFCDTKETWHLTTARQTLPKPETWMGRSQWWTRETAENIAMLARREAGDRVNWVLLTGGEPAEQELRELVRALHRYGFKVALESSGTASGMVEAACDWVCISPKINNPGERAIHSAALALANEIKFVISKPFDVDQIRDFCETYRDVIGSALAKGDQTEFCVQPISLSKRATDLCIELSKREGFRLSVQVHHYTGSDGERAQTALLAGANR